MSTKERWAVCADCRYPFNHLLKKGRPPKYCVSCRITNSGHIGPNSVHAERNEEMARLYTEEGWTLHKIGEKFGITRERARQCIEGYHPGLIQNTINQRREQKRQAEAQAKEQKKLQYGTTDCVVCTNNFLRSLPHQVTCSPKCSDLWRKYRIVLDEERGNRHRLAIARYTIKNPQMALSPKILASAHKLVEHYEKTGEILPANRRYRVEGSKVWQELLDHIGVDRANEILKNSKIPFEGSVNESSSQS